MTQTPAPGPEDFAKALRRGWYPVAQSLDLTRPVGCRLLDVELLVFRDSGGRARVTSNQCPHRGAPLSMGVVADNAIQCPYHGWRWDGESGRCVLIPAVGANGAIPPAARLDVFPAREKYGLVWTSLASDPVNDVPHFEEFDGLEWGGEFVSGPPWDVGVNICAAIENFRDVAHFPFVHQETMGVMPHEVGPLDTWRDGFHAHLERRESPPEVGTGSTTFAAAHPEGGAVVKYHAVAPSAVATVMDAPATGKRVIVFAVAPTSLESSRWFMTENVTPGFPVPIDELLALGRAITDEDVAIVERLRPRGFEGLFGQVHCAADAYTLRYRQAFLSFVNHASGAAARS
jgi:phenylpropionate dioxygenase-like ring-hydroxylating dioxygenase large terminal subunit